MRVAWTVVALVRWAAMGTMRTLIVAGARGHEYACPCMVPRRCRLPLFTHLRPLHHGLDGRATACCAVMCCAALSGIVGIVLREGCYHHAESGCHNKTTLASLDPKISIPIYAPYTYIYPYIYAYV
jgi:hypothetical protein